jgi:glyoxylase-like metal-dependent hydrolase (beta-lactamase superfamily II)/ferredoxin
MSNVRRLDTNAPGDFYVTSACINCDQCRQLAPGMFREIAYYSAVAKQPSDEKERRAAMHALLACPTGAIGSENKTGLEEAMSDFPMKIEDDVYFCGFTSGKSFGGSSYFVVHEDGNWLVDAPRYLPHLVEQFREMGGVRYILLTHRDDVADAEKYAAAFGAERIIHALELQAQPEAEHVLEGTEPIDWSNDFRIIPVPGHTKGHLALLYRHRYLFTGDHLSWDHESNALEAHRDFCWFSWTEQRQSMERLTHERFEWILPGHGERIHLPEAQLQSKMQQLIELMAKTE